VPLAAAKQVRTVALVLDKISMYAWSVFPYHQLFCLHFCAEFERLYSSKMSLSVLSGMHPAHPLSNATHPTTSSRPNGQFLDREAIFLTVPLMQGLR
jgi:hypothetical protein